MMSNLDLTRSVFQTHMSTNLKLSFAHPILLDFFFNPTISAPVAALELLRLSTTSPNPQQASADLGAFLWETALDTPLLRPRIAEVVAHLDAASSSTSSDVVLSSEPSLEQGTLQNVKAGLWKQLHEEVGELLQARAEDFGENEENARQWVALNSFLAQCVHYGDAIIGSGKGAEEDRYVSLGDGLGALCLLEEVEVNLRTPETKSTDGNARLETVVKAAAAWVIEAGDVVSRDGEAVFGKRAAGPLWKATQERETRWAFWKRRFAELKGAYGLDEEVRRIATYAKLAMDASEYRRRALNDGKQV